MPPRWPRPDWPPPAGLPAAGRRLGSAEPGPAAAIPQPAPAYYVVAAGRQVVVRASGDGHVTGSVTLPGLAGIPRAFAAAEVFGGTDDRHFVIVVSRGGDLPGVADATVFLLGLSPVGRPGQPSRVNFGSDGVPVTGVALSPDGSMLALSLVHEFPPGQPYGSVEVISLATGAIRTWTGRGAPGYWAGVPSWAGEGRSSSPGGTARRRARFRPISPASANSIRQHPALPSTELPGPVLPGTGPGVLPVSAAW